MLVKVYRGFLPIMETGKLAGRTLEKGEHHFKAVVKSTQLPWKSFSTPISLISAQGNHQGQCRAPEPEVGCGGCGRFVFFNKPPLPPVYSGHSFYPSGTRQMEFNQALTVVLNVIP